MSCRCQKKIAGMAKKLNFGSFQGAAEIFVGFIAAKTVGGQVLIKIPFIEKNPLVGTGVKTALGLFLSGQRSKTMKNVGAGMIVDSLGDIYDQYVTPGVNSIPSVRRINGGLSNFPGDRGFETNHIAATPQYAGSPLTD